MRWDPGEFLALPTEDAARKLLFECNVMDPRPVRVASQVLGIRATAEAAQSQERSAQRLVDATEALVSQTKTLALATKILAVGTAIVSLATVVSIFK